MIDLFIRVVAEMFNTLPPLFEGFEFSSLVMFQYAFTIVFYPVVIICFIIHLIIKYVIH